MARSGGRDRGVFERFRVVTRGGTTERVSLGYWVRYVGLDGKEHMEKAGSKSAAKLLYQKRKTEVLQGKKLPELNRRLQVWTLSQVVQTHLSEARVRCKAWKDQERFAKLWVRELGDVPLEDVTPKVVEAWKSARSLQASKATVNNELTFLRRVFNVAIRDGWTGQNPLKKVAFWKLNNKRIRQLESAEEERLKAQFEPPDWRVIELLVHTGLRRGELLGLTREEVDVKRRFLRIPDPKGGEARFVPLNSRAAQVLKEQLSSHQSEWVFPSKTGETCMDGDNFYHRVWRPALKRAKIKNLRIHDLRHTFCSRLVEKGAGLRTVQLLAGHKSFTTTERYAHLAPDHLRDAVETLVTGSPARGRSKS